MNLQELIKKWQDYYDSKYGSVGSEFLADFAHDIARGMAEEVRVQLERIKGEIISSLCNEYRAENYDDKCISPRMLMKELGSLSDLDAKIKAFMGDK